MKYLLGVDGGNTKTDYLLCTEDGTFVDVYRCGTCSHEQSPDGYDYMERSMREQLHVILSRNHIEPEDIAAAGMGLAGADMPHQVKVLTERVKRIGFQRFSISNDGLLGVKAAAEQGVGICVVCGTGTVVIGMDTRGEILQVGGVGSLSGDRAGGGFIMHELLYYLYAYYFRCGENSIMFPQVMELLGCKPEDLQVIVSDTGPVHRYMTALVQIADRAACEGDAVACNLLNNMGTGMGYSAAGCIRLMDFGTYGTDDNPLPVVQVGSIWHKLTYQGLRDSFEQTVTTLSRKKCHMIPLHAPAATGGVMWAKELLLKENTPHAAVDPTFRHTLLDALTMERYEQLVQA